LEEGVTLAIGGMVLPTSFVIPWMALAPFTLAFTLAVCLTAIELILYPGVRLKKAFTMRAAH